MFEPGQVIGFIIGTIFVLFAAYFVTYFIGTKAAGQKFRGIRNRNISLHDRFAINRNASFCIIEIAEKVYIVGVTGNSMTLLDTLDAAAFAKSQQESGTDRTTPWSATPVGQYGNKLTKSLVAFIAAKTGRELPPEPDYSGSDFSESMRDAAERNVADGVEAETVTADETPEEPEGS